jgi:predicted N-acetyltransferase YhbS
MFKHFHLFELPHLRDSVAKIIYDEFWTDVPDASPILMSHRLAMATTIDSLPLCRIAVLNNEPVGVINLIEYDDPNPRIGRPWLAGLVVAPEIRGQGLGSLLVKAILEDAIRLGEKEVFLGTDSPQFYEKLGATRYEQLRTDFWLMHFKLI